MTGSCVCCSNADIRDLIPLVLYENRPTTWKQWTTVEKRMSLVTYKGTINDLIDRIRQKLDVFKLHSYVQKVQAHFFEKCKL